MKVIKHLANKDTLLFGEPQPQKRHKHLLFSETLKLEITYNNKS